MVGIAFVGRGSSFYLSDFNPDFAVAGLFLSIIFFSVLWFLSVEHHRFLVLLVIFSGCSQSGNKT